MDTAQRHAINLSVLKRHDSSITNIIESSSHVVVYNFEEKLKEWQKKGIEGTMFIFNRNKEPSLGFFVMNRLGLENLMVFITADMEIEISGDFVIYKTADDNVNGLWIYEAKDRERVGKLLQDQARQEQNRLRLYQTPSISSAIQNASIIPPPPPQQSKTDIISMLQKAKADRKQTQISSSSIVPEPIQTSAPICSYPLPLSIPPQPVLQFQPPIYQPPIPLNTTIPYISSSPQYVITSPSQTQLQATQPIAQSLPMTFHSLDDIWKWCNVMSGSTPISGKLQRYEFQSLILHLVKNDPNFLNALYEAYYYC